MMLESLKHEQNLFTTLTYRPLEGDSRYDKGTQESLNPKDLQDFLKRLRSGIAPRRIRYYGVGEYGERSYRPHFHVALFGLGVEDEEEISKAWGHGYIHLGDLTKDSAAYLTGYISKGMTNANDPRTKEWLKGRHPEFSRMSLRPGIGATAIEDIADALTTTHGADEIYRAGDVPSVLKHGRKSYPLGRYLKTKLRKQLGFPETGAQDGWALEMSMQKLQSLEKALEENQGNYAQAYRKLWEQKDQKIRNLNYRTKLQQQKRGKI